MQLILFETTRYDHALDDVHAEVVAQMRALAESIDGFVTWRDAETGLDYWGVVVFATEAGAIEWRDHPAHQEIHARARASLYRSFAVQAFERVRERRFDDDRRDTTGEAHASPDQDRTS